MLESIRLRKSRDWLHIDGSRVSDYGCLRMRAFNSLDANLIDTNSILTLIVFEDPLMFLASCCLLLRSQDRQIEHHSNFLDGLSS
jgi:hypothetical protein